VREDRDGQAAAVLACEHGRPSRARERSRRTQRVRTEVNMAQVAASLVELIVGFRL
jgi:hypothetical protein